MQECKKQHVGEMGITAFMLCAVLAAEQEPVRKPQAGYTSDIGYDATIARSGAKRLRQRVIWKNIAAPPPGPRDQIDRRPFVLQAIFGSRHRRFAIRAPAWNEALRPSPQPFGQRRATAPPD